MSQLIVFIDPFYGFSVYFFHHYDMVNVCIFIETPRYISRISETRVKFLMTQTYLSTDVR